MKERHAYFLSACLIWFLSALLASAFSNDSQLPALEAVARLANIIAGLYMGLDVVLAPETNLFYRMNLSVPWSLKEPGLYSVIGYMWIAGHLLMTWALIRTLANT